MTVIFTKEAEVLVNKFLFTGYDVNRGVSLQVGLFSNTSFVKLERDVGRADLIELTAERNLGYASIPIPPDDILVRGNSTQINLQVFNAAADWLDPVGGYFISTTGDSPKVLFYLFEGARMLVAGSRYEVLFSATAG